MDEQWQLDALGESIAKVELEEPDLARSLRAGLVALANRSEAALDVMATLRKAAGDKRQLVADIATTLLAELSTFSAAASHEVMSLSDSPHAAERTAAIFSLSERCGSQLRWTVLRKTLSDPSARVRETAVDWIGRLKEESLLPELRVAEKTEKVARIRQLIKHELAMLEKGFVVEPRDPVGMYWVTLQASAGRVSGFVSVAGGRATDDESVVAAFKAQRRI
jgi:hypothetical protein